MKEITLKEYTNSNIECEGKLSIDSWNRLSNSFNKESRTKLFKCVREYDSCVIRKTNGSMGNLGSSYVWEKPGGIANWFEIEFRRPLTPKEKKRYGRGSFNMGITFRIDPLMWFTVNRLIITKKNTGKNF